MDKQPYMYPDNVYLDIFLLFIGIGFFLYVAWFIQTWENRDYNRSLREAREFGHPLTREERKAVVQDKPTKSKETQPETK